MTGTPGSPADLVAQPGQRSLGVQHRLQVVGHLRGGRALAELDRLE
jgi:hypothetical protein